MGGSTRPELFACFKYISLCGKNVYICHAQCLELVLYVHFTLPNSRIMSICVLNLLNMFYYFLYGLLIREAKTCHIAFLVAMPLFSLIKQKIEVSANYIYRLTITIYLCVAYMLG